MRRKLRIALVALIAALAVAQAVPVDRTNPPVESEVQAPPAVLAALKRSCWDCHSHETVWGWHTKIAPISWLVAHDVSEGREELNFSRWSAVDAKRLQKLARKIPDEVGEGEMPPFLYVLAHPSAKPTDADRAAIVAWGKSLASSEALAPSADRAAPAAAVQPAAAGAGAGHEAHEHDREEGEHGRHGGR
jgi:hypothetical protein